MVAAEEEQPMVDDDDAGRAGVLQRVLLADVARAYYLDNRSKVEIAAQFGVSRFQIARLLDEARAVGVVSIEIHDPRRPRTDAERDLAAHLAVGTTRIVEDRADGMPHAERVGATVLGQLEEAVRPGMTVGLAWSRTLDAAARHLSDLPPTTIVQLTGAFETEGGGTFTRLLMQMNQRPGVTTYPLYAPLVVDARSTADDLRRQPVVAATLERADRLDLAVVAIGAWRPGESSVWGRVTDEVQRACTAAGAVAEFSGLFIDRTGKPVATPLDGRTIGVSIGQLRRAKRIIGFAWGPRRAEAVIAACSSGLFDTLVVDVDLADALLAGPAVHRKEPA